MRRGTTPTNVFNLDTDLSDAQALYITYQQDSQTKIEKTKEDVTFDEDNVMYVTLTQEDTLNLEEDKYIKVQIRALFADGSAIASNIITTTVGSILKDGEI